jgi:hypothetical protein
VREFSMFRSALLMTLLTFGCSTLCFAQSAVIPFAKAVVRLDAGTIVGNENAPRWNRTVMLAKPRIASGEVSALSDSIRASVSMFILSIVATVDQDPQSTEPKFRLAEVGVGYSTDVKSQLKVIHSDNYQPHGVSLSFIQRQMLAENERQLSNIKTIVRGGSLLMFDVPAILHENKLHRDYTIRHLVWIDSKTGKLATMLWLVDQPKGKPSNVVTNYPIHWVDSSKIEDRGIHVDGKEFTLGIPSKRAFALEQPPAGRPVVWNQPAASLGALEEYDFDSMQRLMNALNEANIASSQPQNNLK